MATAKLKGARALLGQFLASPRFDRVLGTPAGRSDGGLEVLSIGDGVVECSLLVHEGLTNSYSTLHGGATTTLVDVVGTMAILTLDPARPGVSIELSTSFLRPAPLGKTVHITGKVTKMGKQIAFVDVTLAVDGKLVATGRHTKALG